MYGISNSQQQGGGGGGAASITYAKLSGDVEFSSTRPSASSAFFVNTNAATWAEISSGAPKMLTSESDLGLVIGNSYTLTANIDGTSTEFSGTAVDGASYNLLGSTMVFLVNSSGDSQFIIYDHCKLSTGMPTADNGAVILASLSSTPTSATITNFSGTLQIVSPVTITDTAIKTNSSVTMYINSSLVVRGTKTDGSITLTASTEGSLSYEMEILDVPTEGLFEIVNGYVPEIPNVSSNYNDLSNIPVINQDLSESGFTPVKDTYYRHTGTTNSDYTNGVIYKCVDIGSTSRPLRLFELSTIYDVQMTINEAVVPLLPAEKDITNESANVSITGSASPYLFTVTDSDIRSYSFVRLYPMDEDTETWLNEHTLSSIITEESGQFTFKVDTNTLPTAYSIKYVIERFM